MSKHTRGPWIVNVDRGGYPVIDQIGGDEFDVVGESGFLDSDADCANAQLIAAAPDLLESLMSYVDDFECSDPYCPEQGLCKHCTAEAAIAKATQ